MIWPDAQPVRLNAEEHAVSILSALDGDFELALTFMEAYANFYGEDYALRLGWLLTPKGEA